jgi:uncharacterized protein (TIGR02147 family)
MANNVFDFSSYKAFLRSRVGDKRVRKGQRLALAQSISSTSAFISQVLNGDRDLSVEQAQAAAQFLHLNSEETHYFLLMVQETRAGNMNLRTYFRNQREKIINDRNILKNRVAATDKVSSEYQTKYYSSWIYSAIHIAVMIPQLQTVQALSEYLNITPKTVVKALEFLETAGLVRNINGKFETGKMHIHLGNDSENILKHHTNWRVKAIRSLELESSKDMHYSSVVSMAKSDISKLKDLLIESLKNANNLIKDSKEEEVCCLNIDFFSLKEKDT